MPRERTAASEIDDSGGKKRPHACRKEKSATRRETSAVPDVEKGRGDRVVRPGATNGGRKEGEQGGLCSEKGERETHAERMTLYAWEKIGSWEQRRRIREVVWNPPSRSATSASREKGGGREGEGYEGLKKKGGSSQRKDRLSGEKGRRSTRPTKFIKLVNGATTRGRRWAGPPVAQKSRGNRTGGGLLRAGTPNTIAPSE